jgi:transcriptional regulator with XRE-family HTH domain
VGERAVLRIVFDTQIVSVLRRRRAAAGVSQEALAAQANLHRNYMGLLERGQRMSSILTVQRLATALGTMSELLAGVEQEQG